MDLSLNSGGDRAGRGYQSTDEDLEAIRDALVGIRYGSALITIQDGVIVQIDRTDRRRMRLRRRPNDAADASDR
jgi:hypothetical protein